jgi:hypothetical protein
VLPAIDRFVEELQAAGLRAAPVFFDRLSIGQWKDSSEKLAKYLRTATHESVCMIAFVSPGYVASEWCLLEWREMARVHGPFVHTFPVAWKEIDWGIAEVTMNLRRLPDHLRVVYPTFMPMFFPPKIELMAAEYHDYFPVEMYDDRLGWERAVREAYEFIVHRTRNCCHYPHHYPHHFFKCKRCAYAVWEPELGDELPSTCPNCGFADWTGTYL